MSAFDGYDLEREQIKAFKSMEESNKNALEKDSEAAEYTKQYEIELTKKMFSHRENGVQASILERVSKGDPEIADLKFKSALAEAEARASKENINIKKKLFDSIEATKKRELG